VVEGTGPDLREKVGAVWRPPHLLLLDHTAADDPVDGTSAVAVEIGSPQRRRSP
jgi:hypothetical protein